ncbi:MAG: ubiquinone/menaquinone biosynthesis C-methylase UbiE [Psychroserpens sp.]|jgi:ubiquinone/menaquinone biosynthesis C-methylase UbiE
MKESDIKERVSRELTSHTEDDVLAEAYKLKNKYAHIWSYPSRKKLEQLIAELTSDLSDKVVLDYGCGRGDESIKYLINGAEIVYGIDISPTYIKAAQTKAKELSIDQSRYNFQTMDAHELEFEDCTFDLIIGYGILHHLDPKVAMNEIYRTLKPNGRVVLLEPLADNPLLKIFRKFTPKARTVDEAPFSKEQLYQISDKSKWIAEMKYCGMIEAPVAMFTSIVIPKRENNFLLRMAHTIERFFHKKNILNSWNQYIVINMLKRG